jgi:hypothetical protein
MMLLTLDIVVCPLRCVVIQAHSWVVVLLFQIEVYI